MLKNNPVVNFLVIVLVGFELCGVARPQDELRKKFAINRFKDEPLAIQSITLRGNPHPSFGSTASSRTGTIAR
jgi:hypothetical protein